MLEALVGGLACEAAVGPVVVVVIFPLLEAFGEEIGVVDDLAFEQPVELLGIDPVGTLHLAVQARSARADPDVPDALIDQVPVEGGAELLAVVGLDLLDAEGQFRQDVVDELDRGLLVVARVGAQDPQPGAGCARSPRG